MFRAYICRHCHWKVIGSEEDLKKHTFLKHFEQNYSPSYDAEEKVIGEQKNIADF